MRVAGLIAQLYSAATLFRSYLTIPGIAITLPEVREVDLIGAMACGAAGAFCLSREDISDSLAGVAISISLVPPLCVVELSLRAGQMRDAGGAFLLFLTISLSIL